jgi:acetyl esterase/lipase
MRFSRFWQGQIAKQDIQVLKRFRYQADRAADLLMRIPKGIDINRAQISGVPGDWLIPQEAPDDRVILFFHGGSNVFTWGSPHRRIVGYLSKFSGLRTFGVDFRLAPEHIFPAAHEDCYAVYKTLVTEGIKVVLAGESSGGVLALATMLRAKKEGLPQPHLCALLSPLVDCGFTDAQVLNSRDIFANPDFVVYLTSIYVGGNDPRLTDLSPIYADLSGLAPLFIMVGEREILLSESERLVKTARQHGLKAEIIVWPHVWHGWHVLVPQLPEATSALRTFGEYILDSFNE